MMSPTTSSSSLTKNDDDEITTPVLEPDYDDTHLDLTPHYPPNDSPLRAESSTTSTSNGIESTKNSPIVIQQHHHHHHQQLIDTAATIDSIILRYGKIQNKWYIEDGRRTIERIGCQHKKTNEMGRTVESSVWLFNMKFNAIDIKLYAT